ncbi:MAG TPA: SDR family oxidoreductase [Pseudonocardiaceae bacterium]|jgi:NAD(P)-dependent dehydrogenase (short-subunit alcohol dehydrogenase family)
MDVNVRGKRALVTGSSSGLGAATAALLAQEGATVVVHGRDERRTTEVAARIGAETAIGDLATDEGADAVAQAAGKIDILVNNAGSYHQRGWTDLDAGQWARTYNVNVLSGVRMIQRLVPGMRQRGWGRVIQIGGGLASQPTQAQPDYNASLAARHNLAVSLARELKGTGVTSNVVSPGAILVDAVRELGFSDDSNVPNDINRLGKPEEIAGAVLYLCGPLADYVSGATIRVDGGHIRSAF